MSAVAPRTGDRPLVSIVTPSLNQGAFIEATLRSVMRQAYTTIEHIVVDGGSTDETHEILRRYEGRYPLRWTATEDSGMYQAVNLGMAMARGQVLAYLNTDDLYFDWTVGTVVEFLTRRPDVSVVYGDVVKVDHLRETQQLVFAPPPSKAYLRRLGSLFQPAVFWRDAVRASIGEFDELKQYGGDLDFWIRAADSQAFARLDEVLAIERIHGEAKSTARAGAAMAEEREIRASHDRAPRAVVLISRHAERVRTWLARRRLSIRFVLASRARDARLERPWPRFLSACHPTVHLLSFALAQVPVLGSRWAARAIQVSRDCLKLDG